MAVKIFIDFFEQNFTEIELAKRDSAEIYCIIVKTIIGLDVTQKAYFILEKKFIDEDTYDNIPILFKNKTEDIDSNNKKRVSLNSIQAKMHKKKLKKAYTGRYSIVNTKLYQEIDQFKENLKKTLKVDLPKDTKNTRAKYQAL